jgi:hypothetical protein
MIYITSLGKEGFYKFDLDTHEFVDCKLAVPVNSFKQTRAMMCGDDQLIIVSTQADTTIVDLSIVEGIVVC